MTERITRRAVLPLAAALVAPQNAVAQDASCLPVTPVAAYHPSSRAWRFVGKGPQVSEPISLVKGLVLMHVHAEPTEDSGRGTISADIVVYATCQYGFVGPLSEDLPLEGSYAQIVNEALDAIIAVESDGEWTITIEQPGSNDHG